jgi:hypothetical protein
MSQPDVHEHAWEQVPRSWPPRFRCTVKRCAAIGRIQRTDDEHVAPRIEGWAPEQLRPGAYMQEINDGPVGYRT